MDDNNPQPLAIYSSHPIQRYRMGEHRFENGTLKFYDSETLDRFEKSLEQLPPVERIRIKKIDVDAAAKISKEVQALSGGATQKVDSSIGERAGNAPKIGVGSLIAAANAAKQ